MENLGDYYHDERMQKMFSLVEQPKNLDDIDISESFIKNLVLKIISTYGNIKVTQLHDITGLHVDILEEVLHKLEKDGMCAQTGGGFLFSSVEYNPAYEQFKKYYKLKLLYRAEKNNIWTEVYQSIK